MRSHSLKKCVAAVLASALIIAAPGFGCYDALAAAFTAAAGRSVAVPGGSAAVGAVSRVGAIGSGFALNSPLRVSLTNGIVGLSTLSPSLKTLPSASALPAASALKHGVPAAASKARDAWEINKTEAPEGSVRELLAKPDLVSLPAAEVAKASPANAHSLGRSWFDKILGRDSRTDAGSVAAAPSALFGRPGLRTNGLKSAAQARDDEDSGGEFSAESIEISDGGGRVPNRGAGRAVLGFFMSILKMAAGAGAAYGLHLGAAALLPAVFGTVPIAALWAVSSGVFLLPVALLMRYRLGMRDSVRLKHVKTAFDLALGAFIGAMVVAAPALLGGAAVLDQLMLAAPLIAVASYAVTAAGRGTAGGGGIFNAILAWMGLNLLAPWLPTLAAAPLTLGALFGLMALPAITTMAFFIGRIIVSAESGRAFSVPGSLQSIRFPSYTWVMTGVVFALLTGYSPVWTNIAFALWMFLSKVRVGSVLRRYQGRFANMRLFDVLLLGVTAWAAATGFAAPVTFLAIAFLPERAAIWTEDLLAHLLPRGKPAPSTGRAPVETSEEFRPAKWPRFHYWLKTGLALGSLGAFGFVLAATVFGWGSFAINLGIAGALSIIPMIFSKKLIKLTMKAKPLKESVSREQYEAVVGIMKGLREDINAGRREKGKKEIPMPEMVYVPMPVPNAFATGMSPMSAMVGVTGEMIDMTLNPNRTREMLIAVLEGAEPRSKAFAVYRAAVRNVLANVAEDAGPQAVAQAVQDAKESQVFAIGRGALRGVMGHEFSHVMHRDMLLGAIGGTMASGIAFASYGVLWAVGHAETFLKSLFARLKGAARRPARTTSRTKGRVGAEAAALEDEAFKPQIVEPVTTIGAAAAVLKIIGIFAALWAPVIARVLAMTSSRTREAHADEAGAQLIGDPASLAIGLGLLTAWRPAFGFMFPRAMMPRLASQAHIMTVNPIEQLYGAGLLGGKDAAGVPLTKADNWFFELFITHPDTGQRIRRLYDMNAALKK